MCQQHHHFPQKWHIPSNNSLHCLLITPSKQFIENIYCHNLEDYIILQEVEGNQTKKSQ